MIKNIFLLSVVLFSAYGCTLVKSKEKDDTAQQYEWMPGIEDGVSISIIKQGGKAIGCGAGTSKNDHFLVLSMRPENIGTISFMAKDYGISANNTADEIPIKIGKKSEKKICAVVDGIATFALDSNDFVLLQKDDMIVNGGKISKTSYDSLYRNVLYCYSKIK